MNQVSIRLRHLSMMFLLLSLLIPLIGSTATAQGTTTEVTPAQPVITGNTCVDGVFTPPSATFGPTTGVTYFDVTFRNGVFANHWHTGQAVWWLSAQASLADGYTWGADLGEGWYEGVNGVVHFSNLFEVGGPCGELVLAQPTVTGNTCIGGAYTSPSVTFGPTAHITYVNVQVEETTEGYLFRVGWMGFLFGAVGVGSVHA